MVRVAYTRLLIALVSLSAVSCSSDQVEIVGEGVQLDYDCSSIAALAKSEADWAALHEYGILSIRDAGDNDRLSAADSILQSGEGSDRRAFERHVVRYLCEHGDVRAAAAPKFPEPGSSPPELVIQPYNSSGASTGDVPGPLSHDKIVLVSFWATWCIPCRRELPELQRISATHAADVVVYSVLYNESPERAAAWQTENGVSLPIFVDKGGRTSRAYQVNALPTTFIIGPDGRVLQHRLGYLPGDLEKVVESLISARTPP